MDYLITGHGRALENSLQSHPWRDENTCVCDGIFITPDGTIWQCGCRKYKMGHLDDLDAFWESYHANLNDDGEIPCSKDKPLQVSLADFKLEYA
jgi:hypothetical protein